LGLDRLAAPLAAAQEAGLLEVKGHWVRPTEQGRWFLNNLIGFFIAD
jgi:coproporphyrinogen III oxidase-like Fe-S oxidoreductase